jgi:hypothetical protein
MIRKALWLCLCVGGVVQPAVAAPKASPAPAAAPPADDAKEARKAFEAAQKAYRAGKYAAAITSFELAYKLKPHPIIHFNLAKCAEQLGDVPRALRFYRTFLFETPDTADRETVEAAITALERKLTRSNVQQLMVVAEPRDAKVTVDGTALGAPPAFVELGPGDHRVVIEREGLETISRSFVMSTQRSLDLSFTLQPPKSVAAVEPAPTPPPPPPAATQQPASQVSQSSTPSLKSRFWIPLIGVGLGGVAAGVGFERTSSLNRQLKAELADQRQVTPLAERLASQGQTFQTVAWVGVGVAAAGAVATVVFLLLPGEATVAPTASLGPNGASLGIVGVLP